MKVHVYLNVLLAIFQLKTNAKDVKHLALNVSIRLQNVFHANQGFYGRKHV